MFLKNKVLKDERIMAQRYKIGYEGFYLLFGLLLISIIIKAVFLNMPLNYYWTEFAMSIVGAFYVTVRHVLTGRFSIDFRGDNKESKRRRYYLFLSIFSSGAAVLAMGIRNFIVHDAGFSG